MGDQQASEMQHSENAAPSKATEAVLVASEAVPEDAQKVEGIDFNKYGSDHDITVKEMVQGMAHMGFQATAVSEAVRIINDMVRAPLSPIKHPPSPFPFTPTTDTSNPNH